MPLEGRVMRSSCRDATPQRSLTNRARSASPPEALQARSFYMPEKLEVKSNRIGERRPQGSPPVHLILPRLYYDYEDVKNSSMYRLTFSDCSCCTQWPLSGMRRISSCFTQRSSP